MALIEVIGTIKLEPSVIKPEPTAVVEIYPDDVFESSDKEDSNDHKGKHISENKIAVDVVKEEDIGKDKDFCTIKNLRDDERLVLNYNKQLLPQSRNDNPKESSNCENVNWANVYRTNEITNCEEDQRKVKKTYGPSWNKPIHHKEYTYISKTSVICNHCHKSFKRMDTIFRHIKRIHRESSVIYHCPYCPKQSKWDLRYHILGKHKNENEVSWYQCYQCDKKFRWKSGLAKHIESHLGTKNKSSATCPICAVVYSSRRQMQDHVKKDHKGIKYQCEKCSFDGANLTSLKYHIEALHTEPEELPIHECNKCDYKSRYKHLYKRHCKKHDTSYICEKCGFMSNSIISFKLHDNVHKEKIDDKTLKYRCKKCDYKTYRLYSFQVHKLNHLKPEEIKYFYCYHCNFKAKRKDNLKTHVIRHFKKEDVTLQCFICDFSTKKRGKLTEHISRHQKSPQTKE